MNPLLLSMTALTAATPASGDAIAVAGDMTYDAVTARMSQTALHKIEGVWMFPGVGGLIAIERCADTSDGATEYVMAVVRSSNRLLMPGTVIGRLWPTAVRNTFKARLYTSSSADGVTLTSPRTFSVNLTDSDSRLQLIHHRKQLKLNWWSLLPYMFRRFVREIDETPRNLDGCVRVYPEPAIPAEPRYL